jgi:hypothetical protein
VDLARQAAYVFVLAQPAQIEGTHGHRMMPGKLRSAVMHCHAHCAVHHFSLIRARSRGARALSAARLD